MTDTRPDAPAASLAARAPTRPLVVLLVVLTTAGAVARLVFLALHPPVDHHVYDLAAMTEVRTTWWVTHLYLAGPGFPLAFGGFGVLVAAVCLRAGRGGGAAVAGAVLAGAGGLLSGLGFAGEAVTWGYLTDPGVTDPVVGVAVLAGIGEQPGLVDAPILGGFALAGIGAVLVLVGLWRSGAAPSWVPATCLVVLVLGQAVPLPDALRAVPALLDTTILVGLAVWSGRRLLRPADAA